MNGCCQLWHTCAENSNACPWYVKSWRRPQQQIPEMLACSEAFLGHMQGMHAYHVPLCQKLLPV